jgi:hypothetical protein
MPPRTNPRHKLSLFLHKSLHTRSNLQGLTAPSRSRQSIVNLRLFCARLSGSLIWRSQWNESTPVGSVHSDVLTVRVAAEATEAYSDEAVSKVPIDVETDCIDLLSMSGHKMYGPIRDADVSATFCSFSAFTRRKSHRLSEKRSSAGQVTWPHRYVIARIEISRLSTSKGIPYSGMPCVSVLVAK